MVLKEYSMKNLDRLNKQNVRSVEPTPAASDLSLDKLRQVAGGNSAFYSHQRASSVCVGAQ
jgi:hypothetical protein